MYFQSADELLYMQGHGIYVWSVYAAAVVILGFLVVTPILQRRRFIAEECRRLRREQASNGGDL